MAILLVMVAISSRWLALAEKEDTIGELAPNLDFHLALREKAELDSVMCGAETRARSLERVCEA